MKVEIDGAEVEVYTAAERDAAIAETRTAVEGEYKPKLTTAEAEQKRLQGLIDSRAEEFKNAGEKFRRLSDEQVAALDAAQRTIYENQAALQTEREGRIASDKRVYESTRDTAIRTKVGSDTALFDKVKEMYGVIQLEDVTPEQMTARVNAAFGAVGTTSPDLLAAAGFGSGNFEPPVQKENEKSFADTEGGKALAEKLGMMVEAPKQQ